MKVVVLGASDNPERFSFKCVKMLLNYGHEVVPVGIKNKEVLGIQILTDKSPLKDIHTLTLYVGPARQPEWEDFIVACHPKRVIFNPGTENQDLINKLEKQGVQVVVDCTLVMLSQGIF